MKKVVEVQSEDEEEEETSIEEDLGMFDGVTDDEEDDVSFVRNTSKRSIRVQSAPIIIGNKSSPTKKKFEPTVIKPFKMTIRY